MFSLVFSVQCSVQYSVCIFWCAVFIVHCSLFSVYSNVQCSEEYSVFRTVFSVYFVAFSIQCSLQFLVCSVQCVIQSVQCSVCATALQMKWLLPLGGRL